MPEIALQGALQPLFDEFIDSFNGGFSRYGGTGSSFTVSAGFPYGSTLTGNGIFLETSGPDFMRGTVTGFYLAEITLSPTTVTRLLEFTGLSIDGASLIDLVARTSTTIRGNFDEDVLAGRLNSQSWEITGSSGIDVVSTSDLLDLSRSDTIYLLAGADRAQAGAGNDKVYGGSGRDSLFGESGRDILVGAGGNDILDGGGQADVVLGGAGNDIIDGGAANDRLVGGQGRDVINGGGGADFLTGSAGNDLMSGGAGRDTFQFNGAVNEGRDRILDFNLAFDEIKISGATRADVTISEAGLGTRIALDSGTEIILIGVQANTLTLDDLSFV
ncbi:MAG: calcium-binding protein [Sedimentitalea sp.]